MSITITRHTATTFTTRDIAATVAKLLGAGWTDTQQPYNTTRVAHTATGVHADITPDADGDALELAVTFGKLADELSTVTPDDDATLIAVAAEIATEINSLRAEFLPNVLDLEDNAEDTDTFDAADRATCHTHKCWAADCEALPFHRATGLTR